MVMGGRDREVVAVFAQAGRGLAAAHAAGLLHRDFKPDNVIVDDDGRARVLDFGLARAVSEPTDQGVASAPVIGDAEQTIPTTAFDAAETRSVVAGTPAYMGPEQMLHGKSDERSDQFAFCITLFEALGGARPHDRSTPGETLAAKRAGRIGSTARPIRPRLRAILVRGLSPDPAQRWPSVTDLVDALEDAVRGVSPWTVSALIAGGLVALSLGGWAIARANRTPICSGIERELVGVWDPQAREGATRGLKATGHKNADATVARVIPTLDAYAAAWTAMSTDACEDARVRGTQSMEVLDLRTACLDQRSKELRAAARVLASADKAVVDRAAKMVEGLSPIEDCADLAALREPMAPPRDPEKRAAVERVRDLVAQAKTQHLAGRFDESAGVAKKAIEDARLAGARALEAEALQWHGRDAFYLDGGARRAAEELIDAAIAAEAARHDAFAAESWTWAAHYVGYSLERPAEAQVYARLAEASIARKGGDPLATAHLDKVRANVLYGQGKHDEALALYKQNIALLEQTLGPTHPRTALARLDVGDEAFDRGNRAEALTIFRGVADVLVQAYGDSNPDTQLVLQRVASSEVALALPTALQAAERAHEASTYDDPDVENNLGRALVLAGRTDEGIARIRHALEIAPDRLDGGQLLTFHLDLARALLRAGRVAEAGIELARTRTATAAGHPAEGSFEYLSVLAIYDVATGHPREAVDAAERARVLARSEGAERTSEMAMAEYALGEAKLALHAPEQAVGPLDRALELASTGIDPVVLGQIRDARARAASQARARE
jgi:tetratricopeptide (TPR) repeat protein